MEEQIKAASESVIQKVRGLSGIDFGYNRESVEWLEGYIERLRRLGEFEDNSSREALTAVFGSFLGECIIRCYGGKWEQRAGSWCIAFDSANCVFPFAKVAKQLENGREYGDGIGGFFALLPEVFENRLGKQPAPTTTKE